MQTLHRALELPELFSGMLSCEVHMNDALYRLFLVSFLVLAPGCIIEQSVGPEGPAGPPGNANVFSLEFDFRWIDAVFNGAVASVQYDVPDLTARVVEEGAVIMFFRDHGTWTAMPYSFGVERADIPAVDYTISLGFGYDVGFLEVFYEASTEAVDMTGLPDQRMKLVVIDGFAAGKRQVDLTDWEAVKEAFRLGD
jgi:hypothetical protein